MASAVAQASGSPRPTASTKIKGKGKARDVSPEVITLDSDEDEVRPEHTIPEVLLSPEVPHPPLPEDSFEDDMWADVETLHPLPPRSVQKKSLGARVRQAGLSPAWLDTSRQKLKPGERYFVGKPPPEQPVPPRKIDKGKVRAAAAPVRTPCLPYPAQN